MFLYWTFVVVDWSSWSGCGSPYCKQRSLIPTNQDFDEGFAAISTLIAWRWRTFSFNLHTIPNILNILWWISPVPGMLPARKATTQCGVRGGRRISCSSVSLRWWSNILISDLSSTSAPIPDVSLGVAYSFSTLMLAAGLPLWFRVKPVCKTDHNAFLWALILFIMFWRLLDSLRRMPTCSVVSTN